jgi:hypothetical protein
LDRTKFKEPTLSFFEFGVFVLLSASRYRRLIRQLADWQGHVRLPDETIVKAGTGFSGDIGMQAVRAVAMRRYGRAPRERRRESFACMHFV